MGERPTAIQIRPARGEDSEAIHAIRLQPSVTAFTLALPSATIDEVRAFLGRTDPNRHLFVAASDGRAIGIAGLHVGQGKQRHGGAIGMQVDEAYQGQGVGRALLTAVLDLADNYLALQRVELEVLVNNERAIKLYESCGFAHEGRKRAAMIHAGRYVDVLVMGRLRPPLD